MLIQLKEAPNNLIAMAEELERLSAAHFNEQAVAARGGGWPGNAPSASA